MSSIEDIRKFCLYPVAMFAVLILAWAREGNKPFPTVFDYTVTEERVWLDQVIDENEILIDNGVSYLICAPTVGEGDCLCHMCRYVFWSENVLDITVIDTNQLDANAENFEYILLYDDDNLYIQEWVKENYPDQIGKTVIVNIKSEM